MIEIQVNNQAVLAAFNRLLHLGQDMSPVMHAIGKELETRISDRFETKTDPNGKAWTPWQPATLKSYPKDGNKKLLDRRGDMLASLNYQADSHSVQIGFGQPYAAFHEFGTQKMARRGLLTANPETGELGAGDEHAIIAIINAHLQKAIGG